eukprot:TRINITY_DN16718_c0_g1_i3.p1 TRINITY_DN16718_c0_g1~~TRINITY_DN16718_c0_g1_i3.p1  ORF type:complete len:498 (-),score=124.54 TRINITY_DN16718_c0_g1_i3:47-1540(-)
MCIRDRVMSRPAVAPKSQPRPRPNPGPQPQVKRAPLTIGGCAWAKKFHQHRMQQQEAEEEAPMSISDQAKLREQERVERQRVADLNDRRERMDAKRVAEAKGMVEERRPNPTASTVPAEVVKSPKSSPLGIKDYARRHSTELGPRLDSTPPPSISPPPSGAAVSPSKASPQLDAYARRRAEKYGPSPGEAPQEAKETEQERAKRFKLEAAAKRAEAMRVTRVAEKQAAEAARAEAAAAREQDKKAKADRAAAAARKQQQETAAAAAQPVKPPAVGGADESPVLEIDTPPPQRLVAASPRLGARSPVSSGSRDGNQGLSDLERSEILDRNPTLRALYTSSVPNKMTHESFWSKYVASETRGRARDAGSARVHQQARILHEMGRYDDAVALLRSPAQKEARMLNARGQTQEAVELLVQEEQGGAEPRAVLELSGQASVHFALQDHKNALLLDARGEFERAVDLLSPARTGTPCSPAPGARLISGEPASTTPPPQPEPEP